MKHNDKVPECPFISENDDVPLSHLIRVVFHLFGCDAREKLDKIGIPHSFGPVLTEISRHEGLSQCELAEKMFFKPSSVSVTIQKMEDSGYILREPHESDARQFRIFLTESGKALADKIRRTFEQVEKETFETLTPEEITELRRILEKLRFSKQ